MGGRCRPQFLAEQTAQQGDQGNADQGDTTASHELLHTLTLCGGIITAVAFHEVHRRHPVPRPESTALYLLCFEKKTPHTPEICLFLSRKLR